MESNGEDGLAPKTIDWKQLIRILARDEWSTCTFVLGPASNKQMFRAHRIILALSSPVFQDKLLGTTLGQERPIRIARIQPKTFNALLQYIYTDEIICEHDNDETFDLLDAAKKFRMPELAQRCIKLFSENLLDSNEIEALKNGKHTRKRPLMWEEPSDDSDSSN